MKFNNVDRCVMQAANTWVVSYIQDGILRCDAMRSNQRASLHTSGRASSVQVSDGGTVCTGI